MWGSRIGFISSWAFFWYRNSVMERIELFTNFNFESLCILTSAHFDDIDIGIDPVYDVGE